MSDQVTLAIVLTLIPSLGLGGLIVAVFNHYSGKKKELEEHQRERKENQYKIFLENLIGFFEGWEDKSARKRDFMEELYTHAPLYASSEVIRLANNYVKSFADNTLDSRARDEMAGKLVLAIRKEVGIDKKSPLGLDDIKRYKLLK